MGITKVIKEMVSDVVSDGCKLYLSPNIEDKKLNNAMKAMKVSDNPDEVIAILDTSIFQNAKTGILFSSKDLYVHESFTNPQKISYDRISTVSFEHRVEQQGDEEKQVPYLLITFNDDEPEYELPSIILNYIDGRKLADLLDKIIEVNLASDSSTDASMDTEESTSGTIRSLEDLPTSVKLAYIQLICNFAFEEDQEIDSVEYRGIISLAARIELPSDAQPQLANYLVGDERVESAELLRAVQSQVNEETQDILHKSIMKDVLNLANQKEDVDVEQWHQDKYLSSLAEELNLSAEQVDFLVEGIQHDQNILKERLDDNQIKKQTKALAAKATAVGVPLTALYFSGSVVGVSAVGITSGLSALGFGGIFAFSSMVTGIGVLIVAGTLTYEGVQHLTGRKDVENNKQREALLQQIIRNTQKTLNYLINSVNGISQELAEVTESDAINRLKIDKMTKLLVMLSKGAKETTTDLDYYQSESILTGVPNEMNTGRLRQLTKDPTTKQFYDVVMKNYEEDDEGKMKLKATISSDGASALHEILDSIGYLTVKGVAKSELGIAASTIKGVLK